jgi:septal ring factor EnvC (AmiA/AmiB activator)
VALWVVAGLALLVAAIAWSATRRLTRRLDTLNQSYWELRYDYTRLRSQVARLDPEQADAAEAEVAQSAAPAPQVSFVPLASIKRQRAGGPDQDDR